MKKTRPELRPAEDGRPGYALLVLSGWAPEELEIGARAELCVQRNQDQRYLGDSRQWTATQTWHQVSLADSRDNDAVLLALDPVVVDPLVENPQMAYQVQIRIGAENGIGVLRIREGVLSSHAAGQSTSAVNHVSQPAVVPAPPEPAPVEAAVIEEPVVDTQPKSSNKLPLVIGLVVLLVVAAAAFFAWRYFTQSESTPSAVQVPTTSQAPAPVPAPEPHACSAEAMIKVKDDLVFIQSCLKTEPDSTQVLAVIAAAKKDNRCDLAQRLYAFKGQSGDVPVALAYAAEFDPATFTPGCFKTADKETAIYWYELVLSKDPANADAKARLDALRK
jgi:hypothetical protein